MDVIRPQRFIKQSDALVGCRGYALMGLVGTNVFFANRSYIVFSDLPNTFTLMVRKCIFDNSGAKDENS